MILRWGTSEEKVKHIKNLQHEAKSIVEDVISMIYFMRGALTYYEAMNMSVPERKITKSFLDKRLEYENKKMYPQY